MALGKSSLPRYETILPFSKKKIKFRPFNVREQKNLALAIENDENEDNIPAIISAIQQLFEECAPDFDVEKEIRADSEALFLKMREKAIGETMAIRCQCGSCEKDEIIEVRLDDPTIVENNGGRKTVQVDESEWVELVAPSLITSYLAVSKDTEEDEVIARCIKTYIEGDTSTNASDCSMDELRDYINSRTSKQLTEIENFFMELPDIFIKTTYKCRHCETENSVELRGIENFFV